MKVNVKSVKYVKPSVEVIEVDHSEVRSKSFPISLRGVTIPPRSPLSDFVVTCDRAVPVDVKVDVTVAPQPYTLPKASAELLGGVTGVTKSSIDNTGRLLNAVPEWLMPHIPLSMWIRAAGIKDPQQFFKDLAGEINGGR